MGCKGAPVCKGKRVDCTPLMRPELGVIMACRQYIRYPATCGVHKYTRLPVQDQINCHWRKRYGQIGFKDTLNRLLLGGPMFGENCKYA